MEEKRRAKLAHQTAAEKKMKQKAFRQEIRSALGFDKLKFKGAYATLD